ncbi:hypothetical protein Patl1_10368 [Pistacia atlantica]|uniref:Uncharacterized protein n=1 Tax=Pistacia atlantica TaxID=434234 RepID=A0ACC1A7J7_9ROSI|nr:hypothetical protein Patl1_10368 [Pistacia atlantica]
MACGFVNICRIGILMSHLLLLNSDLSCNYLNGSLPKQWASMQCLNKIRISDNNFVGTIPEFLGGWTSLQRLEMHSSGLEGPIPHSLFGLGNLSDLYVKKMDLGQMETIQGDNTGDMCLHPPGKKKMADSTPGDSNTSSPQTINTINTTPSNTFQPSNFNFTVPTKLDLKNYLSWETQRLTPCFSTTNPDWKGCTPTQHLRCNKILPLSLPKATIQDSFHLNKVLITTIGTKPTEEEAGAGANPKILEIGMVLGPDQPVSCV